MQRGKHQGWAFALGFATLTLMAAGCGDDDKEKVDAGPPDAGPPGPAECVQMAEAMEDSQFTSEQVACLCDKCLDKVLACNDDDGCNEILACASRTGCTGVGCYLAFGGPPPECMAVIDSWGGPQALSPLLATEVSDCNDAMCGGMSPKVDAGSDEDAGK